MELGYNQSQVHARHLHMVSASYRWRCRKHFRLAEFDVGLGTEANHPIHGRPGPERPVPQGCCHVTSSGQAIAKKGTVPESPCNDAKYRGLDGPCCENPQEIWQRKEQLWRLRRHWCAAIRVPGRHRNNQLLHDRSHLVLHILGSQRAGSGRIQVHLRRRGKGWLDGQGDILRVPS